MKTKWILLLVGIMITGIEKANAYDPPLEKGKEIFSVRCAACHNVNKQLTGPALAGLDQRRSMSWIVSFIRSSQSLVKNGDKDAIAVFENFNKIPMPDHTDLTEENIKDIVAYIKSEAKPEGVAKVPFAKPGKLQPNYLPLSIRKDSGFFVAFGIMVALLIGVLFFAVQVRGLRYDSAGK
ncbi:MAG: c-type cytochrome [Flavitalea sp.]